MTAAVWTVVQAKARFSELVDQARTQGPQTVTRHGRSCVVVVSVEEWEAKTRPIGNLAEFLAASPLAGSGMDITRVADGSRELDV
jgi:prevent-host-death family protein